jgi:transcriptional regulator with XRE-family HTH domain
MENKLYLVFKSARESKQMTQKELADRVGIDQSTLSHFEAGKLQIDTQTLL